MGSTPLVHICDVGLIAGQINNHGGPLGKLAGSDIQMTILACLRHTLPVYVMLNVNITCNEYNGNEDCKRELSQDREYVSCCRDATHQKHELLNPDASKIDQCGHIANASCSIRRPNSEQLCQTPAGQQHQP